MKLKDLIIGNISQLINEISQKIIQTGENSNLYTISLVKNNQLHKLPNINVSTLEQLLDFYEKYKNNPGSFDEVWYCKKQINKTASPSCVGRISFHTSDISLDISNEQILEQVWNTTHRDIESFNENYSKSYVRAHRNGFGRRYIIDKMNIQSDIEKDQIVSQYISVVKEIEQKRDSIENFIDFLQQLGINEFSLEYLLEGSRFSIIDWDSQDDLKVISSVIEPDIER